MLIVTTIKNPTTPPGPPRMLTNVKCRYIELIRDGLAAERDVAAAGPGDVVVGVLLVLLVGEEV